MFLLLREEILFTIDELFVTLSSLFDLIWVLASDPSRVSESILLSVRLAGVDAGKLNGSITSGVSLV